MHLKLRPLVVAALAVAIFVPMVAVSSNSAEAATISAHEQQVRRLYWVALGREGDAGGVRHWTQKLFDGRNPEQIVRLLVRSREGRRKTAASGRPPVANAYHIALNRAPDAAGLRSWSVKSETKALVGIANSKEHRLIMAARPQPTPAASGLKPTPKPKHPASWVNAGNGVYVPPVLIQIRQCESGGNYKAQNPRSSASGAYQFIRGSWAGYGHRARFGTSTAAAATPAQQDQAAVITYQRAGTRPWRASQRCWE